MVTSMTTACSFVDTCAMSIAMIWTRGACNTRIYEHLYKHLNKQLYKHLNKQLYKHLNKQLSN